MILSPKGDNEFKVKYVPDEFDEVDQGFFSQCSSENIQINGECLKKLEKLG